MRKVIFLAILLLATIGAYAQDVVQRDTIRLSAEESVSIMMRKTKSELQRYMKGAAHEEVDSLSDIYYIYSPREQQNIPIQFFYSEIWGDGKLRVWKAEFISRKPSKYKTNDLKAAFWIEYIKDILKE